MFMLLIKRVCSLLLLLLLAGCFQQAGEPYQPASSTEIPIIPAVGGDDVTELPPLTVFPATATFPPLTVIAPTQPLLATEEPTPFLLETEISEPVVIPTSEPGGSGEVLSQDTTIFITPDIPLGPITQEPIAPLATDFLATATPSGLITPTAFAEVNGDGCTYTIQPGDNLFRIAVNHNVSLGDLRAANPQITGDLIQPGDQLQIPGCGQGSAVQAPADTVVDVPPAGDSGTSAGGTVYTVVRGDTLFSIARRFGVTVQMIVNANNITNPNSLTPGQQLVIPPA